MFDPAPTTIRTSPTSTPIKHAESAESETLRRLRAARERISDKTRWCQGMADLEGRVCVIGALALTAGFTQEALVARAWHKDGNTPYSSAVVPASLQRAAHSTLKKGALDSWPSLADVWFVNDTCGHTAALKMLDRAIEIEQQQQHA